MNGLLILAFALYVAGLVWLGFRRQAGFASWHMFTELSRCHFELWCDDERLNVWDYLPHSQLNMDLDGVAWFLGYLRIACKKFPNGHVVVIEGPTSTRYEVQDGCLLD